MLRAIKRTLLWAGMALIGVALLFSALIVWPDPLFAYALGTGRIVVASDRPIPSAGGERFLRDCERLLERSPLKAKARRYRLYVTNADWRQRLFFLPKPKAWGLAYSLSSFGGPAFLSGADFDTGINNFRVWMVTFANNDYSPQIFLVSSFKSDVMQGVLPTTEIQLQKLTNVD